MEDVDENSYGMILMFDTEINMTFIVDHEHLTYILPESSVFSPEFKPKINSNIFMYNERLEGVISVEEVFRDSDNGTRKQSLFGWREAQENIARIRPKWERRGPFPNISLKIGVTRHRPFLNYPKTWDFKTVTQDKNGNKLGEKQLTIAEFEELWNGPQPENEDEE